MLELTNDFIQQFKKSCPRCHKTISAEALCRQLSEPQMHCPHCLAAVQPRAEERHLHEAVLVGSCLFLSLTLFALFPIWLQLVAVLVSYRAGLFCLPLLGPLEIAQPEPQGWQYWVQRAKTTWASLLKRRCPSCEHELSWEQRLKMRQHMMIACPGCRKILRVHPRDQLVNALLLGWGIHQVVHAFFGKPVFMLEVFAYLTIASTPMWRYFESLFSFVVWPQPMRDRSPL